MDLIDTFPTNAGDATYEGFVKVKLAHAHGYSVLLPDMVIVEHEGCQWFQPQYFSACLLTYHDDDAYAQLNIDTDTGVRLFIGFTRDRLVRHLPDGSSIYRCRIAGPANLQSAATGICTAGSDGNFFLKLYHHTDPATVDKIRECGYFLGSRWNIQGC